MPPDGLPDAERAALLTIDVQRDFTRPGAPAEIPGTEAVVPAIARLVKAFRAAQRPVVHVIRLYQPDGSNAELSRRRAIANGPSIVAPGTPGAKLVGELRPEETFEMAPSQLLAGQLQRIGDDEYVMYKPRWGAFYDTPLEEHLGEWGVETVVVCGCNFPNCPRTTVYEASERDFRVHLVADATSGTYDRGLEELRDIGVTVATAAETAAWVSTA